MIDSIGDLQNLVRSGVTDFSPYGHVNVQFNDDLVIFCYSTAAQYAARWNFFERISRGLILHRHTGEIVARSFDKFFNWGEGDRTTTAPLDYVTEKLDGSLGILYRHNGQYKIATKGSFDSEQALWATTYLNRHFNLNGLPDELTLLFEIIYPSNRVIVDYGEREDLVLLAARNRFSGDYVSLAEVQGLASDYGFALPTLHPIHHVADIQALIQEIPVSREGFVGVFVDGQRFKFKGDAYRHLHKMVYGFSFKRVLRAIQDDELDALIAILPDEFYETIEKWAAIIQGVVDEIDSQTRAIFETAPTATRKEFAVWIFQNNPEWSPYLFAMFDGKPLAPIVYAKYDWGAISARLEEDG